MGYYHFSNTEIIREIIQTLTIFTHLLVLEILNSKAKVVKSGLLMK